MASATTALGLREQEDVLNARTAEIRQLADEIFEDRAIADHAITDQWLREANLATENRPPIELLTTEHGYLVVKALLERIEYGVLA